MSRNEKARTVADLLERARQALSENDLTTADTLVSQAEALGVRYNIFYMGDTPKKARRDLERRRNSAPPPKPSQKSSKTAPSADPFAGRAIAPPTLATTGVQVTPLPTVDSPAKDSQNPLRTARLALAVGDVRRAGDFVGRARATQQQYGPSDDTPEKVEAAIRRHQELLNLDKNTEAYARGYSRSMMEQADGLARWGELDEAERLAGRAAQLRLTYGPFEPKPQEVLARIADARRQKSAAPTTAAPPEAGYAVAASDSEPIMASRKRAVELVRQAREAMAAGRLDQAEMLARQAEQMRLPEAVFAPGEDRPALVLLDLRQLRGVSGVVPAGATNVQGRSATVAVYDPANDPTRNVTASNQQSPSRYGDHSYAADPRVAQSAAPPRPVRSPEPIAPGTAQTPGMALFYQGETALRARDMARAYDLFRQAAQHPNDLDTVTAQRLRDHLQLAVVTTQRQSAAARPSAEHDE